MQKHSQKLINYQKRIVLTLNFNITEVASIYVNFKTINILMKIPSN